MKKQWLSMILALCMVLCLTPTTAHAAEGKTCEVKITVEVKGLPESVSAAGTTFTFQVKKAINVSTAHYFVYDTMTVTVGADGKGTSTVPVEEGTYIVKQDVPGKRIGEYVWDSISYTGGNNESGPQSVYGSGKSIEFKVYNTYKPASVTKVTSLPITVTGYKAGANVANAEVTTTESGIDLSYFRFMEKISDDTWTAASLTETFKANTDYKVEVYFKKIPGCDYTGLTGDSVTVNGVTAHAFETTWSGSHNEDYRVVHGLGKPEIVKKVKSIEITKEPDKTEYMAGEDFDPTGMVVTAVYDDNSKAVLPETGYTIFRGTGLTKGQEYVTIQYDDGSGNSGINVRQPITVGPYVGDHQHTYDGSPWYADTDSHWHQCTREDCPDPSGSTKDQASHTFVWKVDKAATRTRTGLKHEECTVCRYKRNEDTVIPVLSGHRPATRPDSGAENTVITSAKTGDAGIALHAGLSLLALSGSGWVVGKKRRGEK